MKKTVLSLLILFLSLSLFSQQKFTAYPGKKGVFIYCGDSLPKSFYYAIERSAANGGWITQAELSFPSSCDEFRARLLNGNKAGMPFHEESQNATDSVWKKLKSSPLNHVLGSFHTQTIYLAAAGCGYWDESAEKNTKYNYRLVKKDKTGRILKEDLVTDISFPGKQASVQLKLAEKTILGNEIQLDILVTDYQKMMGCRVYRNHYLMKDVVEIFPRIGYRNQGAEKHMIIHDENVTEKAQYTYRIVAYDFFGNEGKALENIDVYNVTINSLTASVSNPGADGDENQNAIRIHWKTKQAKDIISIDIYRGTDYNGYFGRIVSLGPKDTSYLDRNVKPMTTYHYSIVVTTAYARSYPSVRFNGVLKANRANLIPPQGLTAVRKGNVVNISWKRSTDDTKGYYVYRGLSYLEEPKPISSVIRSADSILYFTDSLKDLTKTEAVLVYAVADENSSYNFSPLSNKVAIQSLVKNLPVAFPVDTRLEDGRINLLWQDYFTDCPGLSGFNIYRQCIDLNDKIIEDWVLQNTHPTAFGVNSFIDKNVKEGFRYIYALEAVGVDNSKGSRSPGIAFYLEENLPQPTANLIAVSGTNQITLSWDPILDSKIQKIAVYRSEEAVATHLLNELRPGETQYLDTTTKAGNTYYYYIVTIDQLGRKCRDAAAVGIIAK